MPAKAGILLAIAMKKIAGFHYKNITTAIGDGERKVSIRSANTYNLGLPPESVIMGYFVREFTGNDLTQYGGKVIGLTQVQNTFVSLLGADGQGIVKRYPYLYLSQTLFNESKKAKEIDWSGSYFEIGLGCPDSRLQQGSFEIIIAYSANNITSSEVDFVLRGQEYEKLRYWRTEINTQNAQQTYALSNQTSIGIDEDYFILGFDLRQKVNNFSGKGNLSPQAIACGFLTVYKGENQFIDHLPLSTVDNYPIPSFNKPYLPINPTRAGDIDWEKSNLFFSDITTTENNKSFSLGIIYADK